MEYLSAGMEAGAVSKVVCYERHRPERTLLYQIVEQYYPELADLMAVQGKLLPGYVRREFEEYLKCGLEHGFLRLRCDSCHAKHLLAFSCKRRGFCPSCGARRMAESAALLVDEILPQQPMRQWVLSVPFQLRFLFAYNIEFVFLSGKGRGTKQFDISSCAYVDVPASNNTSIFMQTVRSPVGNRQPQKGTVLPALGLIFPEAREALSVSVNLKNMAWLKNRIHDRFLNQMPLKEAYFVQLASGQMNFRNMEIWGRVAFILKIESNA